MFAQLLDHGQGQGVQGFFRVQGGNGDACTIGAGEFFDVQVHRDLDGKFKRSV
ncbi:hypothetical protein QMK56_03005 [Pseudomonas protegens]|uniref:hypothetical protein n=1 Tax=Pseudomonas protegens TaxID=380021 RepID=UPI002A361501|nr:hypothetical protein [Pseudomonas protegens]MDX9680463.1 hypothetical protein [Pseudomonas protegens]